MAKSAQTLDWSRTALPVLRNGGRFPMVAHNAKVIYGSPATVALHLYGYTARMWMGRRLMRIKPGDLTLTPAGMLTHYDLDKAGHHLCLHFAAMPVGETSLQLPLHWRTGSHERWVSERLQEIIYFFRLGEGEGIKAELARQASGAALQSLLFWIAVTAGSRRQSGAGAATRMDGALEQVRRHLDEHYRVPIDVPALARQVGVSQNRLSKRFRIKHGMTLQRYLLSRRIELARHLLTVTDLPLKVVAIEAGLGNPQYFHRQFRRATGHNPSEERELAARRDSKSCKK